MSYSFCISSAERPNIVFILSDDHAVRAVSAYSNSLVETPNIDRTQPAVGYQTAVIGKWHLYSDPVGFDHWDVIDNVFEQGSYYNPSFRSTAGVEQTTGYVADLVTDKSIVWLEQAQKRQAFFPAIQPQDPTPRLVAWPGGTAQLG